MKSEINLYSTPSQLREMGGLSSLTGLKMPRAVGSNLATGDSDIYTVPTGKKAYITGCRAYNPSAGNIPMIHQIKVSGTYYKISLPVTTAAGAGSTVTLLSPIILNAGESMAVNTTTTAGLNLAYSVYEFDATNPFTSYRNLALSNGDNTLYTVPTGKTAAIGFQHLGFVIAGATRSSFQGLFVSNNSGGSLNYLTYNVPNGGSSGITNQFFPATAIVNTSTLGFDMFATMAAGDFLVVNTSAGGAGQVAWVNIWEF